MKGHHAHDFTCEKKRLQQQVERLRQRLIIEGNKKRALFEKNAHLRAKCEFLSKESKGLADEMTENKKKYADEVQKCFELADQMCKRECGPAE